MEYIYVWLIVVDTSICNYEPVMLHIIGGVLQHRLWVIFII